MNLNLSLTLVDVILVKTLFGTCSTNQDLFVDKNAEIDRQRIYLFPNLKRIEFFEFSDEFFFETIPSQEGFNKFTFLLQPSDAKLLISDTGSVLEIVGKVFCLGWYLY